MDSTTENTCESFESNTSESKTPESSIDCAKSSIFDQTDASSTKTSSNPFAPKSEIRVANLHPENLLHAGTKTHVAATMRQGYGNDMYHHKRDIAALHDEFAIKYLAHVASHPNLEVFEQQRNNLSTLEQEMFWPDMAIELDDPVGKTELGSIAGSNNESISGVNNKFIFVHSIILRRCKYFSDAIEKYKQQGKTFFPVIPVKNCLHKNVIEILRLFYCREISIDISDEKSVKDLQVLAKLWKVVGKSTKYYFIS